MGNFKIRFMIIVLKFIMRQSECHGNLCDDTKKLINELEEYLNE